MRRFPQLARWALLLPLTLLSLPAQSACRPDQIDWQADDALSRFLTTCERPPTPQETRLYTWGHQEKFALLTHDGYDLFSIYNDAQQFAYAGIQARVKLASYADYPRFPFYTTLLRSTLGTATVGQLYGYSLDGEMLARLQQLWQRQVLKDSKIPAPAENPSQPTDAAAKGLMALAYNQVNPGFLDDLPYSVDDLIKTTSDALKADTLDTRQRLTLQGRLLGLKRAKASGEHGKPSNISYGPAVYFSNAPETAVQHYYDANHTGIVCRLLDTDRITDLSEPADKQAMLAHGILLHDAAGNPRAYPGGYNELANPVDYRLQTRHRLIKIRDIYADTGVIQYSVPGVCRPIRLNDFSTCPAVVKLLSVGHFNGGREPGPLYRMLTLDQPEEQLQRFLGLVRACTVTPADVAARQAQRLPALPNSCRYLEDEWFKQTDFYRRNRDYLDAVVKARCS
ncbi:MAG: hypothetical protein P8178_12035 [Candidatus Thiodiazotropha sp.]